MRFGRPIPRRFFARSCLDVARDLVGCVLVRASPEGERTAARLVEVEAYLGDGSDAGSHAHRGRTPRNATMFGPPGHLYVYLSYGMHLCANVVAEPEGRAAAVLLRAAEPLEGIDVMLRRRRLEGARVDRRVAGGPGRFGQAFGFDLGHDGASVLRGEWTIREATRPVAHLEATPRIGLSQGADLPYRFVEAGSRWLSRPAARAAARPRASPAATRRDAPV